jgi:hypothetical protein
MADTQILKDTNIVEAIERSDGIDGKGNKWVRYSVMIDDEDWNAIEFGYFYRPAVKTMVVPEEGGPVTIHFIEDEYQGVPQYNIRKIEDSRAPKASAKPKPRPTANGKAPTDTATASGGAAPAYGKFQAVIDLVGYRATMLSKEAACTAEEAAEDCVTFAISVLACIAAPTDIKTTPKPKPSSGSVENPPDDDIPF